VQGVEIKLSNRTGGGQVDKHNDNGFCPCSAARHIRYNFTLGGAGAQSTLTINLLGYIE